MVKARPGRSNLGCLIFALLLAGTAYFGYQVGVVYLRYYQFRDAIEQEARFAGRTTDTQIIDHLRAKADSLDLPAEAQKITVRRRLGTIRISTRYSETVEFPFFVRVIQFNPAVQRTF